MRCPRCQSENEQAGETCFACGAPLSAVITRGSVISDRYEVLAPLGRGGMGAVYKAYDRVLEEDVAIKVLRPDVARTAGLERRFRQEIKLARKVRHRNVCAIHEYGEDKELRFISMEYVEGVDLRQLVRREGPFRCPEALEVAAQIADGLHAVHEVGIVHRDLKTPNIMRDRAGVIRLMDFGIAKEVHSETRGTATGVVVGTPEYMSPEQARGERVGYPSDVYALGIVLFEILTGDVPFRGDTPLATLMQHVQQEPPLSVPALPGPVRALLRRALAKQASERPTAAGFAEELRRAAIDPPPAAEPGHGGPRSVAVPAAAQGPLEVDDPDEAPTEIVEPMAPPVPAQPRGARAAALRSPSVAPVLPRRPPPTRVGYRPPRRSVVAWAAAVAGVATLAAVFGILLTRHDVSVPGTADVLPSPSAPAGQVEAAAVAEPSERPTLPSTPLPSAAVLTPAPGPPPPTRRAAVETAPSALPRLPLQPHEPAPRSVFKASPPAVVLPSAVHEASVPAPTTAPSSAAAPPPLPSSPEPGYLNVVVAPWAAFAVNGETRGTTPSPKVKLPAGAHVVRLQHPEYEPVERTVEVVPGGTTTLRFDFRTEGRRR